MTKESGSKSKDGKGLAGRRRRTATRPPTGLAQASTTPVNAPCEVATPFVSSLVERVTSGNGTVADVAFEVRLLRTALFIFQTAQMAELQGELAQANEQFKQALDLLIEELRGKTASKPASESLLGSLRMADEKLTRLLEAAHDDPELYYDVEGVMADAELDRFFAAEDADSTDDQDNAEPQFDELPDDYDVVDERASDSDLV